MLSPTFSVCIQSKGTKFIFKDTTGLYNSSSNPNGWRGPNEDGDDVISAVFRITTPSGSTYDYEVTPFYPQDVEGDILFPAYEGDWEDGIYTFEYILNTGNTYNICKKMFFSPNIDCCIDEKLAEYVDKFLCTACPDAEDIVSISVYRDLLHTTALIKNETQINKILEYLENFCTLDNC